MLCKTLSPSKFIVSERCSYSSWAFLFWVMITPKRMIWTQMAEGSLRSLILPLVNHSDRLDQWEWFITHCGQNVQPPMSITSFHWSPYNRLRQTDFILLVYEQTFWVSVWVTDQWLCGPTHLRLRWLPLEHFAELYATDWLIFVLCSTLMKYTKCKCLVCSWPKKIPEAGVS